MEFLTQHNFEIQTTSLTVSMIGLNSCVVGYLTVPRNKDTMCLFK